MELEELMGRIEAAFDQAVERRDRLFLEAAEKMRTDEGALDGLAAQLASSDNTAVIRALAVILDREVPPPPPRP